MKRAALVIALLSPLLLAAGGKSLYGRYCLSCHDTGKAPSLRGVGALAADFYLTTGYMPLQHVGSQPRHTQVELSRAQIRALVAYVASLGKGPPIPTPHPERGSVSAGFHLFTEHCAGCHQVVAQGGYVTGAVPPPLGGDSPTQIAEAVRIGPYVMPTFSKRAISDAQLDSIIRYVEYAKHPDDRGGWSIGHVGPIPEGLVAWLLGAGALVGVCLAVGRRRDA
jgi:quinol---cytochrome-c reductase cytochrome c subunit